MDLDNTLADYDSLFVGAARDAGFVDGEFAGGRLALRAMLRARDGGEDQWQALQRRVYGPLMSRARLFDGAADFLNAARVRQAAVYVVSHKTRFGHHDARHFDLRQAAWAWMAGKGFFDAQGFAVRQENVFFESTRDEKIGRIAELGLTHFIDDLPEVLSDPAFPPGPRRILFDPAGAAAPGGYPCHGHWAEIREDVFGERS